MDKLKNFKQQNIDNQLVARIICNSLKIKYFDFLQF